jgi:hypothetical protein
MLHPIPKAAEDDCFFVAQSSLDGVIETARFKVGLDAGIERVRVLVEPYVQFFQLLRRQRAMARSISWTVFKPRGPRRYFTGEDYLGGRMPHFRYLPGGRHASFGGSGVSIDGGPYYPNNLRIFSLRLLLIY